MKTAAGFSLVEMLVAATMLLVVTAGLSALLNPSLGLFSSQPEAADLQQRLRVASDSLFGDLVMAGAGAYAGSQTGSLVYYFAPVVPSRQGAIRDDPPGTFRSDAITFAFVPSTPSQTTISQQISGATSELHVNLESNCPLDQDLCGFEPGQTALIFDDVGDAGAFTVLGVGGGTGQLQINRSSNDIAFRIGSKAVQAVYQTYFLNRTTWQLMHYDGSTNPDVPVVDHVVDLRFEYYGEPRPPQLTGKSLDQSTGPWTTYGPRPPPLGAQLPGRGYPAGESCIFTVVDGAQVPRLPDLSIGGTTLVRLDAEQLTDGPWCPDAASGNRWDADLLRIRKIAVTLRVESANAALRGPAGLLFANGGTSVRGNMRLPDVRVTFQLAPPNLNLTR